MHGVFKQKETESLPNQGHFSPLEPLEKAVPKLIKTNPQNKNKKAKAHEAFKSCVPPNYHWCSSTVQLKQSLEVNNLTFCS